MSSAYDKDMTTSAIVLAGGSGNRAKRSEKDAAKQFVQLGGKPLLSWSLETLSSHAAIKTLVLVLPPEGVQADWHSHISAGTHLIVAQGGQTRRDSTLHGLEALAAQDPDAIKGAILVHDGARPFVTHQLVDRLLAALDDAIGAIPALQMTDTLKIMDAQHGLTAGPDRTALATVQTPQAFRGAHLLAAHRSAQSQQLDQPFTDDASIVEWAGHTCRAVEGDANNLKVTAPEDWARAEAILAMTNTLEPRTGIGYDVHRLVPGDGVWLCGHFIAHTRKLDGHSDADVGLHALTDALLGAIGAGDIGTHFPPSDPQWKGAESHIFLAHAAKLIRDSGGKITNVDVAIVAENPKVGPHREAMTARMADILGIAPSRVSVKATTNERMGFAGREEGIGALATASVMVPADD